MGRYDRANVFLDGVAFPNSVKVWRKGILVTAAPDILYAEDTDGDGRVDLRQVLYHGFGEGNQQHRVNGMTWGSMVGSTVPTATAAAKSSRRRPARRFSSQLSRISASNRRRTDRARAWAIAIHACA